MPWCYRIKKKYIRLYELFTGNCGDRERQQTQWTEMLLIPFQTNMQKDVYNSKWKYKGYGKSYWKSDCNLLFTIQASPFLPLSHCHKLDTMIAPWKCLTLEKQFFSRLHKVSTWADCLGYCPFSAPQLFTKILSAFDASSGGIFQLRMTSAGLSSVPQKRFLSPPALRSAVYQLAQLFSWPPALRCLLGIPSNHKAASALTVLCYPPLLH